MPKDKPLSELDSRMQVFKAESSAVSVVNALLNPEQRDSGIENPPINLKKLSAMHEISSALRPLVDAYATNIDARGYHFTPEIDLNSPDAPGRIQDALLVKALLLAHDTGAPTDSIPEPTEDEIKAATQAIRNKARLELAIARKFFANCVADTDFTDLRRKTRQDFEICGNAYWEILRDPKTDVPCSLVYVPGHTVRIGKITAGADKPISIRTRQRVTELYWEPVVIKRKFNKFCQVDDAERPTVWFKEFGDTRLMSRDTGTYYENWNALIKAEKKNAKAATELLHFGLHSSTSIYGIPRWAGNIPAVLGSRELDETNLDYFLSNCVPALALLCAGGKMGAKTTERLTEFFTEEVRGRRATHKLIILEAESSRRAGSTGISPIPKLDFIPLRNAQVQDALFQNYDERNTKKIGKSFRLPDSLVGGGKFTTSDLRLAEEQVYQPEREWFDARINKHLMPALKITFWQFKSNSTMARDPQVLGELVLEAAKIGVIVPLEARKILECVFNTELPTIRAQWAAQPIPMTMAALGVKAGPAEAVREQGRQAGDTAPIDRLLRELGLSPEDASLLDTPEESETPDNSKASLTSLMEALKPLGNTQSTPDSSNE